MFLKGAMAKHIERQALCEPLPQLFGPHVKKWGVYFHAWMTDIAYKGEISGCGNMER